MKLQIGKQNKVAEMMKIKESRNSQRKPNNNNQSDRMQVSKE